MLTKNLKPKDTKDKEKPEFFNFFLVFSMLVLTFASLTVSVFALQREIPALFKSVLSRGWTKTEGKIIKTETLTRTVSSGSARSPFSRKVYVPNVNYSFQVGNETFTGERINFAGEEKHFSLDEESKQFLNSFYPLSRSVEVFYNPNNPRESTLSREYVYDASAYQAGCCCGGAGVFFGILLWLSIRDLVKIFRKRKK